MSVLKLYLACVAIAVILSVSGCTANLSATDLNSSFSLTKKGDPNEKTAKTVSKPVQAQLYKTCCASAPKKYA